MNKTKPGNTYLIRWKRERCNKTRDILSTNFIWGENRTSCTTLTGEFRECKACQYNISGGT